MAEERRYRILTISAQMFLDLIMAKAVKKSDDTLTYLECTNVLDGVEFRAATHDHYTDTFWIKAYHPSWDIVMEGSVIPKYTPLFATHAINIRKETNTEAPPVKRGYEFI